MGEIDELKRQRNLISEKIKKIRETEKVEKNRSTNSKGNVLTRVGFDFNNAIEEIITKRIENGRDVKRISKPQITNLIVKHKTLWNLLKSDILNYNFEDGEKNV